MPKPKANELELIFLDDDRDGREVSSGKDNRDVRDVRSAGDDCDDRDGIEVKRESLAILTSLGTTKEFIGVEMSLAKIHKLSAKDVEKFYNRYQTVAGQKVTSGLVESAIETATKVISYVAPIDNPDELCSDLQKDELVKRELSNFAGLLVVRGGRLVALASALVQVVRHIKFNQTGNQEMLSTTEQTLENENKKMLSTTEQTLEID